MTLLANFREALRSTMLGQAAFAAAVDFPLVPPQAEVRVWFYGMGEPQDVTDCHSVACPMPSIFCMWLAGNNGDHENVPRRAALHFIEHGSRRRLLGRVELEHHSTIDTSGPHLQLYRAKDCTSTCVPSYRRWMRSMYMAHDRRNARRSKRAWVSSLDQRCNEVAFFCPRPIALVSVSRRDNGNIFPMNLMGQMNEDLFVFALNSGNKAGAAVLASSELAISTIPFARAEVVRGLGRNHHQRSINFDTLPFRVCASDALHIPIPDFALTVRELRVESTASLGSHDFFIARIVNTQVRATGPEFYRIHGLYAAWRSESQNIAVPE